jgi:hypothetical protein
VRHNCAAGDLAAWAGVHGGRQTKTRRENEEVSEGSKGTATENLAGVVEIQTVFLGTQVVLQVGGCQRLKYVQFF